MKINLKVNSFVLEIWAEETKCCFYTVRKLEEEFSETDKFLLKYKDESHLKRSISELVNFIVKYIGQKTGALSYFFRFENKAHALPPPSKYKFGEIEFDTKNFPLRLYCLRISDEIVVLFNGSEKNSQKAQDGQTKKYFDEANFFASKIDKAIIDKNLIIDFEDGEISLSDGGSEIIID